MTDPLDSLNGRIAAGINARHPGKVVRVYSFVGSHLIAINVEHLDHHLAIQLTPIRTCCVAHRTLDAVAQARMLYHILREEGLIHPDPTLDRSHDENH